MTSPARVLHVVESWPPARTGYAARSRALLEALGRRTDVDPHVVVTSRQDRYHPDVDTDGPVPVTRAPTTRSEHLVRRMRPWFVDGRALADHLTRVGDELAVELVHVHWGSTIGAAAATAAARLDVPLVAEVRFDLAGAATSQWLRRPAPWLEAPLRHWFERHLRRADLIVAASPGVASMVARLRPDVDLVLAPNGVDHDRLAPQPPDPDLARRLDLGPPGELVVAAITNLLHYEGVDRLVDLVGRLRASGSPCRGLVVGGGPELDALRAQARHDDVPVTFTGPVDPHEVAAHYALADVVVVPRRDIAVTRHASPLKVGEAMACGRAIVASAVGDVPALLDDGRGLVVDPDDEVALDDAVRQLLATPDRRRELGANAREWALATLDWDTAAANVAAAYPVP